MNPPAASASPPQDVSWPVLLAVSTVIVGALALLYPNVVFTEGEVMQGLFALLTGAVAACVLLGFIHRRAALWCVITFGGSPLLWQAYQTQKWAKIHEEVVSIVSYAEDTRRNTGHYPPTLDGYTYKNPWVRQHIDHFKVDETQGFRIDYFMNQRGITYWYTPRGGFQYYPD